MQRRTGAGDGESAAGQHGSGAGARHHHQVPRCPDLLQGAGRRDVCPESHRHPGPCGLQLRGLPFAGSLRGRAAGGGCHSGRGGPDAGQHLPRYGPRSGDPAGVQQDRPARRRPPEGQAGGGGHHRPARTGGAGDLRQAGHQHRRRAGGRGAERTRAQGRPQGAAAGAGVRQPVRPLCGRGGAVPHHGGHDPQGPDRPHDGLRRGIYHFGVRLPQAAGQRAHGLLTGRRGRLFYRQHQERKGHTGGRHHHRCRRSRCGAAARLPAGSVHGVLRHLHRGWQQVPRPAGRAGEAPAQRCLPDLRAGILCGAGLWLPLRISGNAPHGDHSGAAGARIQSGPCHHAAQRDLPRLQIRRHYGEGGQPPQLPRPGHHRARGGAVRQGVHHHATGLRGEHYAHVSGAARRVQGYAVSGYPSGGAALSDAAQRDHLRLFRHAEGQHQGLRLPGL